MFYFLSVQLVSSLRLNFAKNITFRRCHPASIEFAEIKCTELYIYLPFKLSTFNLCTFNNGGITPSKHRVFSSIFALFFSYKIGSGLGSGLVLVVISAIKTLSSSWKRQYTIVGNVGHNCSKWKRPSYKRENCDGAALLTLQLFVQQVSQHPCETYDIWFEFSKFSNTKSWICNNFKHF